MCGVFLVISVVIVVYGLIKITDLIGDRIFGKGGEK